MSRVRFQLLFGPSSAHPYRMDWSQPTDGAAAGTSTTGADGRSASSRPVGREWYGWRLMGANNRELGRSARSYPSYPVVRKAVRDLQQHANRLVRSTVIDPATGRWGWRLDLDDRTVAVSGRWYERDHDSRVGMDKFLNLVPSAELVDGVVTVHDRRRNGS
jgi:hypothetical protein